MKKVTLKLITAGLFISSLGFMVGCGGNESTDNSGAAPESMVKKEAPADDGQGVGRFKNVELGPFDAKLAATGKEVFEAKCYACHRVTDQKIVGPGLKGITQHRKPAWILNQITNPLEMTQKDPTAKKLLEEHLVQMTFQDVNDDQARAILEYFRQIDGAGESTQK